MNFVLHYIGLGKDCWQFMIACPSSLGHVINFSRKLLTGKEIYKDGDGECKIVSLERNHSQFCFIQQLGNSLCLTHEKTASKGWRIIQMPAQKIATGQLRFKRKCK